MLHPTTTDSNFSNVLSEAIKEDPKLLDSITCIDLDGVREKRLTAVWKVIARSRPDLVVPFLKSSCELGGNRVERIVEGLDLGRPNVRRGWIDFILQRGDSTNKVWTLQMGAVSLMDYVHRPAMGSVGDTQSPRTWYPEFARAMEVFNPAAVVDMSNLLLDNLTEEFIASFDVVDDKMMAELCDVFVDHGAELNRPINHSDGITYPNRVFLLVDLGQKYGHTEYNAMAEVLVELGGDWRTAWNDPQLGEHARRVLRNCPTIRKALLEETLGGLEPQAKGPTPKF